MFSSEKFSVYPQGSLLLIIWIYIFQKAITLVIWEYIQYIDSVMETIEMMKILNFLKPQVVSEMNLIFYCERLLFDDWLYVVSKQPNFLVYESTVWFRGLGFSLEGSLYQYIPLYLRFVVSSKITLSNPRNQSTDSQ